MPVPQRLHSAATTSFAAISTGKEKLSTVSALFSTVFLSVYLYRLFSELAGNTLLNHQTDLYRPKKRFQLEVRSFRL